MVNLTVDDLVRFQTAGVQHEAEINAAQAAAAAAQKDQERYLKIRGASDNRKLRIIRALAQFSGSEFDNFIDNLGA